MNKVLFIIILLISINAYTQTGIGTTTPVNKFEVVSVAANPLNTAVSTANGILRLGTSSGSHVLDFGLSSTSTYAWLQARLKSNYSTPYILAINPNGGNVGIGTSAPSQMLDVNGTARFSTSIINSGSRTYLGKDGANMHWLGTTDNVAESFNLAYGFESNGVSIQSHKWYVQGVEKMKLINNGNLGIGTSTPGTTLHIENGNSFGTDPSNTNSPSLLIYNNNNASSTANSSALVRTAGTGSGRPYYSLDVFGFSGYSIGINNPTDQMILNTTWNFSTGTAGNNAIIINRSGQTRVSVPSSAGGFMNDWPSGWGGGLSTFDFSCAGIYYSTLTARSDIRLKNTINDLTTDVVSKYLSLRPVTYYWNTDKSSDTKLQYGLIAQEVEKLFPEMVNTATDSMQTKSVNYQALHALSLKVIQAQQDEIKELKKKQAAIEERLLKLEAKLN